MEEKKKRRSTCVMGARNDFLISTNDTSNPSEVADISNDLSLSPIYTIRVLIRGVRTSTKKKKNDCSVQMSIRNVLSEDCRIFIAEIVHDSPII